MPPDGIRFEFGAPPSPPSCILLAASAASASAASAPPFTSPTSSQIETTADFQLVSFSCSDGDDLEIVVYKTQLLVLHPCRNSAARDKLSIGQINRTAENKS
ncbi:hypothetical protein M0802_000406 [Mischocyttarus mexicanus]|nr:hypothetical protein M0802_000406 [Mischocyttarus mexicanus]